MHSFKDSEGREWRLEINVDAIRRVKSLVEGVNLANIIDKKSDSVLERLWSDVELRCNVLYALCKPQADTMKPQITDEDFGRALGGNALMLGMAALEDELTDFFQQLGRPEVVKAIQKMRAMTQAMFKTAEAKLDSLNVEQIVEKAVGKSFTNALRSLESTQDHSPSES